MSAPLMKICGLTKPADAVLCHEAGADLLGVILAPSARQATAAQARAIRQAVPDATLVGVVTDPDPATVTSLVATAGLDLVQLHGCAEPVVWRAVSGVCGRPVLPAVTADRAELAATAYANAVEAGQADHLAGLLLDLPKLPASAGEPAERSAGRREALWLAARAAAAAGVPVFLAGQLSHQDIPAAVRAVRPHGLDVCRGTERAPGQKDPDLVRRVLAAARDLEETRAS
jgi:phosphoribosylanthranilate isomerase